MSTIHLGGFSNKPASLVIKAILRVDAVDSPLIIIGTEYLIQITFCIIQFSFPFYKAQSMLATKFNTSR